MAHSSSLIRALDVAEKNTGWSGTAFVPPHSISRPNQHSVISTVSSKDVIGCRSLTNVTKKSAANISDTVKASSPLQKVIISKQPKPLRGCVTGLLIKDICDSSTFSSEAKQPGVMCLSNSLDQKINSSSRDPQHSSSLLHNNMSVHGITDVSIRNSNKTPPPENGTDLSTSLSESNNIHQQKFGAFPNPRIGYLCPRCKSLCNDTKACGHCGLPAAQNQETLQTLDADPTNVNPVNRTLITHSTLSPRTFYARKLQELSCSASITVNSMRIIQRRTPRRGVKRPVVDPPECLTLSSDDECLDSKEPLESFEEESHKKSSKVKCLGSEEEKVSDDKIKYDKITATSGKEAVARPLSPVLSPNFKVVDLHIPCRSIRIGSFKVAPDVPLTITSEYFSMTIPTVKDYNERVTLRISLRDIVGAMAHFGRTLPIIMLYTTPGCAGAIRSRLRMSNKSGPFYDSRGADETQKRIIFLPEILSDSERITIKVIFRDFDKHRPNPPAEPTFSEIEQKLANEILVRSTPPEIVDHISKLIMPHCRRTKSLIEGDSNEKLLRRTPVIIPLERHQRNECITTMLIYPPPPQTGGITITTEDVNCLEPGEFINDVIIDFYLKYIHLEKLSEVDRKRTHIFSSFFYKRLTHAGMPSLQSIRSPQEVEDRSLPLPERRHRRVKTWTRHVDIFEKDFIIIPINESSHWFLAIICYPYLSECSKNETSAENNSQKGDCDSRLCKSYLNGNQSIVGPTFENNISRDLCDPSLTNKEPNVKEMKLSSTCPKRPCILLFDSLPTRNWSKVVIILREYLRMEWKAKRGTVRAFEKESVRGAYPAVPQQNNYSDCGIYLLQYVESFFENPITDYSFPIRCLQTWFSEQVINNKRNDIKELILKLNHEQNDGGVSNENHLERAEHPKSPSVAKRLFSQENQIENVEGTKVKLSNEDEKDVGAERMEIDEIDENFSSVMTSQSGTDSSR